MLVERRLDQQHPGRLFEAHASRFGTILSRVDGNHLAVQRAVWVFLADQLAGLLHRPRQLAQPSEPSPERAVRQRGPLGCQRMLLPIVINERPLLLSDRLAIRLGAAQEVLRPIQQRGTDKLFASQSERVDSR